MQQKVLITRKTIGKIGKWLGVIVLVLAGVVTGLLVGYGVAGQGYDVLLQGHYDKLDAHFDSHPSETASCVGKPEPCAYAIDLLHGLGCASWWQDNGRIMKMYCAPIMPPRRKPQEEEPAVKGKPKVNRPEITT